MEITKTFNNNKQRAYEETYISFETAKLLKEKGFDYICDKLYNETDKTSDFDKYIQNIEENKFWWCPSQAVVMKWLRDIHKIVISIYPFDRDASSEQINYFTCDIATPNHSSRHGHLRGIWISYEKCAEDAIQYCLKMYL